MGKGRKKIPDELKKQRGTDQPSRMTEKSVQINPVNELPTTPVFLNKEGKRVFRSLGQYLLDLKILNEANMMMFTAMCREYGIYWEAESEMKKLSDRWDEIIDKDNNKKTTPSAKHTISKESLKNALRISTEFGLTPASISKIVFDKSEKPKLEDLLK